jgi:hypothetical protein
MKARIYSQQRSNQGRLCASCGAPYLSGREASHGRPLWALWPGEGSSGVQLCPACRQRDVSRRIGACLSTRM